MSTEFHELVVSGMTVHVVRKAIKNLHLGVYPPHGRVRVAAPLRVNDNAVRSAVVGKLGWIKRQRTRFEAQPRQSVREMVSGESHYSLGRRYRLCVVYSKRTPTAVLITKSMIELHVPSGTNVQKRERLLLRWYRQQLKAMIPPMVEKWEARLGVELAGWGIKRMKTRWGTCNAQARRIWLNLELAKKPLRCLEYILVHELVHLVERHHDARFIRLMDEHLPLWRQHRQELNSAPLAHENWTY